MITKDADTELKVRMQKVLWSLGYYTRANVKLVAGNPTGTKGDRGQASFYELTDLDVLGIRVGADLAIDHTVADCTTRSRLSPINRAFWLRGLMLYFGADHGYIVLTRDTPAYQKDVAAKLGITLVDDQNLARLEESYTRGARPIPVGDAGSLAYLEGNLAQLGKDLQPLLFFRRQEFWFNEPWKNILRSISLVQQCRDHLRPDQKFHKVLFVDLMTLFSLALLELCGHIFRTSPTDFRGAVRSYLFGGTASVEAREALVKELSELVQKLLVQAAIPFTEEISGRLRLEPPYFDKLSERAVRLVNKPNEAKDILRYMQAILLEQVLYDGSDLQNVFGDDYSEITFKFVIDLAQFYIEATGANPALMPKLSTVSNT